MFADDVVIWVSSASYDTCLLQLQAALDMIEGWSGIWGLRVSPEKSKAMLFARPAAARSNRVKGRRASLMLSGHDVPFVANCRYLGVTFDSHMTWRPHVKSLHDSLTSRVNVLKTVSAKDWGADRTTLILLYKYLVLSKIEYGSQLYSAAAPSTVASLASVQYQCLKIASGAPC